MVLRLILRFFTQNERIIQKLAESPPMKRAAQLTAYFFLKGKSIGEESFEKFKNSEAADKLRDEVQHKGRQLRDDVADKGKRLESFTSTFSKELQEGFKDLGEEMKKKR